MAKEVLNLNKTLNENKITENFHFKNSYHT